MAIMADRLKELHYGEIMRITRKGWSWAEKLCQKVEKKVLSLVNELENKSSVDLLPFSDISLGHGSMLEDSEEKKTFDEIVSDEKLSLGGSESTTSVEVLSLKHGTVIEIKEKNDAIDKLDSIEVKNTFYSLCGDENVTEVFSMSGVKIEDNASDENLNCIEQSSAVDLVEDSHQATFPNELLLSNEKYIPTDKSEDTLTTSREFSYENFHDGIPDNQTDHDGVPDNQTDHDGIPDNQTDFVPLSSQFLSSVSHQSKFPLVESSFQPVNVEFNVQKRINLLETCESGYPLLKGSEMIENCVASSESDFPENLNSFCSEDETKNHSFFQVVADDIDDIADVNISNGLDTIKIIDDFWDDILNNKTSLIASQEDKKLSFKEKLKRMLFSRLTPSSDNNVVNCQDDLLPSELSDSEWELL